MNVNETNNAKNAIRFDVEFDIITENNIINTIGIAITPYFIGCMLS
jgi:hypothetical protein